MKMKLLIALLTCVLLLVTGCQTTGTPVPEKMAFLDSVVGIYKGVIASATPDSPGTTNFSKDANGNIIGAYEYADEHNVTAKGALKDCKQTGDSSLHCQWVDKYGTGDLKITFDANASKFTGAWNLKGSDFTMPWTGAKEVY